MLSQFFQSIKHKDYIQQLDSFEHRFSARDFDASYWERQSSTKILEGGRGGSLKITIQHQPMVLHHFLRGGLVARVFHDLYVWMGFNRSRPFLENKVITHALQNKLPVPEVVAFYIRKNGIFYSAYSISRYIENTGTLASYLFDHDIPDARWIVLGKLIKKFHRKGIFHADLNANNILMGKAGDFYLIDFDKAQIVPSMETLGPQNLQRLFRSINKIQAVRVQQNLPFHFNQGQWEILLDAYAKY